MNLYARALGLAIVFASITSGAASAAGDVTAVMQRGSLVVRGDDAGNFVTIQGDGIAGLVLSGEDGTSINGGAGPALFPSLGGQIAVLDVDLRAGDDTLFLDDVANALAPASLRLRLGRGNDFLGLVDSGAPGDSSIDMGAGDDGIRTEFGEFGGSLTVTAGTGSDGANLFATTFGGSVSLDAGSDDDGIVLDSCVFQRAAKITLAKGNDTLRLLAPFFGRAAVLAGGGGQDTLDVVQDASGVAPRIQGFEVLTTP